MKLDELKEMESRANLCASAEIPGHQLRALIATAKRGMEAEEIIGWIFGNPTASFDEIQSKCAKFLSVPL